MTSEQNAIVALMTFLYENREELSKDKFSGMHKVDDVYRIHKSSFVPKLLNSRAVDVDRTIAAVADIYFHNKGLEWDQSSYWITIS
jgi:hypothetical protein